jgi:hypothetical protein
VGGGGRAKAITRTAFAVKNTVVVRAVNSQSGVDLNFYIFRFIIVFFPPTYKNGLNYIG